MFGNSTRLFAIRGIDVRVDTSWLLIAALVAWFFWSRLQIFYGHEAAISVPFALLGAVLFFASVLFHELAHALEGQRRGIEIGGITLFLFGGVTETRMDAERPGDEFALSVVGPWSSLVLGCALGLVVYALGSFAPDLVILAEILGVVGWINIGLALFNLLPGAPLDGGRVLRSAIWKITGDRQRAVRGAGIAGQGLGALMIGYGVLVFLTFAPGSFGALWWAFIGWFLYVAAKRERVLSELRERLEDRRVSEVVTPSTRAIDEGATAAEAERALARIDAEVVPVHRDGVLVGAVSLDQVRDVPDAERERTAVREVMTHREELETVDVDDPGSEIIDLLMRGSPVVVTQDGEPAGVLSPAQATRALQRISELGGRRSGRAGRRNRRASTARGWLPASEEPGAGDQTEAFDGSGPGGRS